MSWKHRFLLLFLLIPALFLLSETLQDEIVYVTNTGRMYHQVSCRHLSMSRIAISLADAVLSSYNPCSVCRPPIIDISSIDITRSNTALYRVNIAGLQNTGVADIERMVRAEVVGHIDGDTVRVRIPNPPTGLSVIETIRFLGVDTPETVHPNRQVEFFGQEASDFTRNVLFGRNVFLAFDWDLRDRYGRLLAYIYTESGDCLNAMLIMQGFGHAYLRFPFQFMEEFREYEQEARREGRGLWGAQQE